MELLLEKNRRIPLAKIKEKYNHFGHPFVNKLHIEIWNRRRYILPPLVGVFRKEDFSFDLVPAKDLKLPNGIFPYTCYDFSKEFSRILREKGIQAGIVLNGLWEDQ